MRNAVLLLIGIVLLYLIPSLLLQAIYGPSYGFLSGEDCWLPDGKGGWMKHGHPASPRPDVPSVQVPISVRYIPIFLPASLLILFMFTPLKKYLDIGTAESGSSSSQQNDESTGNTEPQ